MKIYISTNNKAIIKKHYPNIFDKQLKIIDVPHYCSTNGYIKYKENVIQQYILNQDIKKMLNNFYRSKRFDTILYVVDEISLDFIDDFNIFLKNEKIYFTEFILIDCLDEIDHELYNYFTTIL